jgi:conjugative transfer region protein (TIGR03748 family)
MPLAVTHPGFSGAVRLLAVSAFIGLAAGCAGSSSATRSNADDAAAKTEHGAVYPVQVVRHGRYTLVEVRPDAVQQHLLEQIVDISLPRAFDTTVGDALQIVLQRTGYQLCEADPAAHALYALPLPAVHVRLGPLTLDDALRTLAGPEWTLDVDPVARRVCFVQNDALELAGERLACGSGVNSAERPKRAVSNDDRGNSPRRSRR